MPMTPQQVLNTLERRKLSLRHVPDQGWVTHTDKGPRVRVPPKATMNEAVEAADNHLSEREQEMERRDARRLVALMQQGEFYHLPRLEKSEDPEAGDRTVFDLIRSSDDVTVATGAASVVEAWISTKDR